MNQLKTNIDSHTGTQDPAILAGLTDAAQGYLYNLDGVLLACPLVMRGDEPYSTGIGKLTPEGFRTAADEAYTAAGLTADTSADVVAGTVTDTLADRGLGIDCSGFVTSVLTRGLGSVGLDPFTIRAPHADMQQGYPIEGWKPVMSTEHAHRATARQAALLSGDLDHTNTRVDYDMQRIVDNSGVVEDGSFRIGDVIVYAPGDPRKDVKQLGHVALVMGNRSSRVKLLHSGGRSNTDIGGVQGFSLAKKRITEQQPDKTPLVVRRLHVLDD